MLVKKGKSVAPQIGVLMPNWVGDACMATPALRALRKSFPQAHFTGIVRPVIRELLAGADGQSRWFDETLTCEKKASQRLGLVRALRSRRLDAILLLTNSFWSAAVSRLAGVPTVVGYDRDGRGWLLSERIPVPLDGRRPKPQSAVDYYLELARHVGCETDGRRMQLDVDDDNLKQANKYWSRVNFEETRPTVVINSNAATSAPRIWPREKVMQLARSLAATGTQVILHCGPPERAIANRIATEINHPLVASLGILSDLPIRLSLAVLSKADVVVSTDSGPRHMAVALDKPVVSLFGPTDPAWTGTYNDPEEIIEVGLEQLGCRPCYKRSCPLKHHRCMQDITVSRVFQAIQRRLRTNSIAA